MPARGRGGRVVSAPKASARRVTAPSKKSARVTRVVPVKDRRENRGSGRSALGRRGA